MSSRSKQTILLVGATGKTGSSIVRALAKQSEKFYVKALVRAASLEKPIVQELKSLGVGFISGDIVEDSQATLENHLKDVDTVIITTVPFQPNQQDKLILAAKNANVKRVVPSDFGPSAPPGAMKYQDSKVVTQEFIKQHNIPYTFIQVGTWANLMFPAPHSAKDSPQIVFYGSGDVKTAYTGLERVGEFVARIISDERTLNKTVQTYDGEATLSEVWAIASKVSGENFDDYTRLSAQEVKAKIGESPLSTTIYEYVRTLFISGDNTVENAVALGALDSRVLYPDYVPLRLEDCAREFYSRFDEVKAY
ncbi:hypothetical protein V5O48_008892 [Marasmius crinis-equi]|uniref:NmrA-like domain-containing protein n=1 Tax=Marasmius crinis-equi TaxID=585013 RepID=A0ABR3FCP6_9AGAR